MLTLLMKIISKYDLLISIQLKDLDYLQSLCNDNFNLHHINTRNKRQKKFDPLSVRPRTFDKHIYCMGCQAIIRETLKEIKQSRSEVLIEDALSRACDREFKGYAYISRTVESGCTVFIGGWRDQLSEHLMKRESNESIEDEFCVQYTKACFEIDPLEVQKYRKEMYQKQPVLMDGKYYMPDENGYVDKTRDMVDL